MATKKGNLFTQSRSNVSSLLTAGKPEDEIIEEVKETEIKDEIAATNEVALYEAVIAVEPGVEVAGNQEQIDMLAEQIRKREAENTELETIVQPQEHKSSDSNGKIILFKSDEEDEEKQYINFYLKKSTIAKIKKLAGKGRGKTGKNQSALVDFLLNEAFNLLEIK